MSMGFDVSDRALWAVRCFENYVRRYVDPVTGICYNSPINPAAMGAADHPVNEFKHILTGVPEPPANYARPDLRAWPTPEEVACSWPHIGGWNTPIEDCALQGGLSLIGLCGDGIPFDERRRRELIALIFKGLVNLWRVPGQCGHICRGFLPTSRAFYRQTTHDQVPEYLYALMVYGESRFASETDRKLMKEITHSFMEWMRGNQWNYNTFPDRMENPACVMSTAPYPLSIVKFLALFGMAYRITGDSQYMELYRTYRDEGSRWRVERLKSLSEATTYQVTFILMMLKVLALVEDDPDLKKTYQQIRYGLANLPTFALEHPFPWLAPGVSVRLADTQYERPDWRPAFRRTVDELGFKPFDHAYWYALRANINADQSDHAIADEPLHNQLPNAAQANAPLPDSRYVVFKAWYLDYFAWQMAMYRLIMCDKQMANPRWIYPKVMPARLKQAIDVIDFEASGEVARYLPIFGMAV